jgi:hypothetical protein
MAYDRLTTRAPIFTAQAADGSGVTQLVQDFKNVQLKVVTSGSADFTLRIQGSLQKEAPDFSGAPSETNQWDYVAVWDYQDPINIILGDAGIPFSGTDDFLNLLVNVDGLVWLNCEISGYAAGEAGVELVAFNNQ